MLPWCSKGVHLERGSGGEREPPLPSTVGSPRGDRVGDRPLPTRAGTACPSELRPHLTLPLGLGAEDPPGPCARQAPAAPRRCPDDHCLCDQSSQPGKTRAWPGSAPVRKDPAPLWPLVQPAGPGQHPQWPLCSPPRRSVELPTQTSHAWAACAPLTLPEPHLLSRAPAFPRMSSPLVSQDRTLSRASRSPM